MAYPKAEAQKIIYFVFRDMLKYQFSFKYHFKYHFYIFFFTFLSCTVAAILRGIREHCG